MSSLPKFQTAVMDFVDARNLNVPAATRVLDLTAEVGELAKEVLGGSCYGREPFSPTENWAGELGDVFFSLICVANGTGVNLETALDQALDKYHERLSCRDNPSSGR